MRWDIFCRVIDNFGDAGIAWRLAKCLVDDHGQSLRLIVDDLSTLKALCPEFDSQQESGQCLEKIEVFGWDWVEHSPDFSPAQGVIEIFASELPPHYKAQLHSLEKPPVWVNYEYLSAEAWVKEFHGLFSPQSNGLRKLFFFPGFEPGTGGLLREGDYFERYTRWQRIQNDPSTARKDEFRISLFGYENAALPVLIESWAQTHQPMSARIFEGRLFSSLPQSLHASLKASSSGQIAQGNLSLIHQPFVAQAAYDEILWACDLNFVRGEESFVRAQWAGKPFIWHIYPTEDLAHLTKLDAFLALYTQNLSAQAAQAYSVFSRAWNNEQLTATHWQSLMAHWPELLAHALDWQAQLNDLGDCATNLLNCIKNQV